MTDTPLPGLPAPEAEPLSDYEMARLAMDRVIHVVVRLMREANPRVTPMAITAELVTWVANTMADGFGDMAPIRDGILRSFEHAHPQAMSFIDINHTKKALVTIAAARRKVEAASAGIITH